MTVAEIISRIQALGLSQQVLKDALTAKGFTCAENDHFPELSPMVGDCADYPYAVEGTTLLSISTGVISFPNLPQKPKEFGLMCKPLRDALISSSVAGYVVTDIHAYFENENSNVQIVDGVTFTRTQDPSTGLWTLEVRCDATSHFHVGYEYTWLILFHVCCEVSV